MRQTYTLVFEFPDDTPDFIIGDTGMAIEDIMNDKFPKTYHDVVWKEPK